MSTTDGLKIYPFVEYNGWTLFPWPCMEEDPAKHFKRMKGFRSRTDDVLFITACKSGTHWMHEILCMLIDQTTEYNSRITSFDFEMDYVTDYSQLEASKQRRIMHSHLPFSFIPEKHVDIGGKIIYVNRNPKDRYVSQYAFFKNLIGFPDWNWDTYFKEMVLKDTFMTGWFHFTREMTNAVNKYPQSVLPVMFEDLILDPVKQITIIAEFLEVPFTKSFVETIAEKCLFKNLKENKVDASTINHPEKKSTIFRKGVIGDWKNWFTVSQSEEYDALLREEMKGFDVNFIYEYPKENNPNTNSVGLTSGSNDIH